MAPSPGPSTAAAFDHVANKFAQTEVAFWLFAIGAVAGAAVFLALSVAVVVFLVKLIRGKLPFEQGFRTLARNVATLEVSNVFKLSTQNNDEIEQVKTQVENLQASVEDLQTAVLELTQQITPTSPPTP